MSSRSARRLMAVLAHPDDESLGFGGTLARYAAQGDDVFLVTATRGDAGRFRGHRAGEPEHPGPDALARIREAELRAAAAAMGLRGGAARGIREVAQLGYRDRQLDSADPREAIARIVGQLRQHRPEVVLTFGPDGAYGHPDHIAIAQLTTAAVMAAGKDEGAGAHLVSKLYYLAWPDSMWSAYQAAVHTLSTTVDGVERHATPWPDWAITTTIDTSEVWPVVWRAVACHESQLAAYEPLAKLPPEHHRALWGRQSFYRAMSLVNGGRTRETDLFEGVGD